MEGGPPRQTSAPGHSPPSPGSRRPRLPSSRSGRPFPAGGPRWLTPGGGAAHRPRPSTLAPPLNKRPRLGARTAATRSFPLSWPLLRPALRLRCPPGREPREPERTEDRAHTDPSAAPGRPPRAPLLPRPAHPSRLRTRWPVARWVRVSAGPAGDPRCTAWGWGRCPAGPGRAASARSAAGTLLPVAPRARARDCAAPPGSGLNGLGRRGTG